MLFPGCGRERDKTVREDPAMISLLMEAVVIAFSLGAVIGGMVAIQLMQPRKEAEVAEQGDRDALER